MLPLKLTIKGIGPHEILEIDFTQLRSPIALVAPYGTGKTFLIGGIFAALYGVVPWYEGSIYDCLTQGGSGEGYFDLIFQHGDMSYCAARTIKNTGKTKTQTARLFAQIEGPGCADPIAGPKVGDFDRAIEALIGSKELALSTWFLSQCRSNDLCGQPNDSDLMARRRSAFNELIGAGQLDAICDKAALKQREVNAVVAELEAQTAPFSSIDDDIDIKILKAENEAAALKFASDTSRINLGGQEADLETARKALRDAQGCDDVLQAQIDEHERCKAALESAERREAALKAEVEALEARAAGEQQVSSDVILLNAAKTGLGVLEAESLKHAARQQWERRRNELNQALESGAAIVAAIESQPGLDDATVKLAESLPEVIKAYTSLKEINAQAEANNARRSKKWVTLVSDRGALLKQQEALLDRKSKRPETPFAEKCAPCPFLAEFNSIDAQVERLSSEMRDIDERISLIPNDEEISDLRPMAERGAEARAAKTAVEAAGANKAKLEAATADNLAARRLLDEHEMSEPEAVADPSEAIRKTRAEIDKLAGAPERLRACQLAKAAADGKGLDLFHLECQMGEARRSIEMSKPAVDAARATLADRETQCKTITGRVASIEAGVTTLRQQIESQIREIAATEARITHLQQQQDEHAEKISRLKVLRDQRDGLADVRLALGPRGVRQILIDNAAPELEAIADGLFETATEGRMRLRISTISVNADGSTRENFEILVRDQRGERDALRYSGGQLQLIRILFRIAVAIWVGQLHGHRPDCLVLDEALDAMGADGADDFLRLLDGLGDRIKMVILVTHDGDIADRLASQIKLCKIGSSVQVETSAA